MPFSFRIGLLCTVAALAWVHLLRTLRALRRAGAPSARLRLPGLQSGTGPVKPTSGRKLPGLQSGTGPPPHAAPSDGAGKALPRLATGGRQSTAFDWERWLHLATLSGLVLFCAPFLAGVAFPGRAAALSAAIDAAITGGTPAPDLSSRALAPAAGTGFAGAWAAWAAGAAWVVTAGLAGGAALLLLASGICRARRRPRAMCVLASLGLAAAAGGFVLAGPAADRLSGALRARRTIEEYARAPVVVADAARMSPGPARLVGVPDASSVGGSEFLCLVSTGGGGRDESAAPVRSGFRVGGVEVVPAAGRALLVARPHVRLGPRGRELYVRADEPVAVFGCLRDGRMRARAGYPLVVAPAGEAKVLDALARDLLGTAPSRRRLAALLQIAFGAAAAWALVVLLASATEYALSLPARRAARVALDRTSASSVEPPGAEGA